MAVVPMPLVPPCTRNQSPAFNAPRSNTLFHTVKQASGRPPASTRLVLAGTGSACTSSAMQYSA